MSEEVRPRLASTVLMLRDGAQGLEVLMVTRNLAVEFASGALVFPGGRIDPADSGLADRCRPFSGSDDQSLALRVAGIRETYEEAGILLARRAGADALMTGQELAALEAALETELGRKATFLDLAVSGRVELATDLMVPFAHWITPAGLPKRYDTHFFVAPAPPDQAVSHDGFEAVETRWISPQEALAAAESGRATVVFATRLNLMKLGEHDSVAAALAAARRGRIVTVCPEFADGPSGKILRIPAEAGYGLCEAPVDRTLMMRPAR
ncbi:MAG: NUDIX domain-containing protein [Rhodospirillales bacterium]|nr:NUDIX domain-containing protein [Rhodospirillales bacterium]